MSKQESYRIVFDDLKDYKILNGQYDAKNGDYRIMMGVCLVMERIACGAGDEDWIHDVFYANICESERKAGI